MRVTLTGTEMALLLGAMGVAASWPCERPAARVMMTRAERGKVGKMTHQLLLQVLRIDESIGAVKSHTTPWPPEFIAKRASARGDLQMTLKETWLIVRALRMCFEEFSANWYGFCIVAPGFLEPYGVSPNDLLALAAKLEALTVQPDA